MILRRTDAKSRFYHLAWRLNQISVAGMKRASSLIADRSVTLSQMAIETVHNVWL
jgi:hypothetical protein